MLSVASYASESGDSFVIRSRTAFAAKPFLKSLGESPSTLYHLCSDPDSGCHHSFAEIPCRATEIIEFSRIRQIEAST
jgi:hypothetical protein